MLRFKRNTKHDYKKPIHNFNDKNNDVTRICAHIYLVMSLDLLPVIFLQIKIECKQ